MRPENTEVAGLNAPYGARCFLTRHDDLGRARHPRGLNAPYGARCFLTPCSVL